MGKFLGRDFNDDNYPEEWIASCVRALNEGSTDAYEGISRIEGTNMYLSDAVAKYRKEILGDKNDLGILVKYLDSAVRLPVQAHPTKEFSAKYFNSEYGKEECWYILDTRPGACVYFGFQEGITKERFTEAIERSETDKSAMEKLLKKYKVHKGDVVFIPANTVHAIGAGCLILEVQEPTDFTVQPERWCGDYRLSDYQMYIGLNREDALGCFDFSESKNAFIAPVKLYEKDGVKCEELIGRSITESFGLQRIILSGGAYELTQAAAVYIVAEGEGVITGDGYERRIKQGDYFLLPASAGKYIAESENMTMLLCI